MKRWRDFATQWAVVVHLSHFLSRDSMRIHKIHTICIISAQYNGCWNSLINYLCQALGGGPTNNKVFEGQTNFEHHCRNASKSTDSFEVQADVTDHCSSHYLKPCQKSSIVIPACRKWPSALSCLAPTSSTHFRRKLWKPWSGFFSYDGQSFLM